MSQKKIAPQKFTPKKMSNQKVFEIKFNEKPGKKMMDMILKHLNFQ